ncbi:MAG: hypothetical protein JEZ09_14470 [Salinivirgaceae bacterium]|nr:hypothetical protein [Salinivirgaceae bacterium]
MNILYAQINTDPNKEGQNDFREALIRLFAKRGLHTIYFAYNAMESIDLFQDHKDEAFWLFSNFPPNSSYVEGALPKVNTQTECTYWVADGYEKSFKLFGYLLKNK